MLSTRKEIGAGGGMGVGQKYSVQVTGGSCQGGGRGFLQRGVLSKKTPSPPGKQSLMQRR